MLGFRQYHCFYVILKGFLCQSRGGLAGTFSLYGRSLGTFQGRCFHRAECCKEFTVDIKTPGLAQKEEKLPAQKEEKQPQKKTALKNKKDSGFFSLSKAISINADSMEYDNHANKGIFKGNVVARQDDIVMFASSMHVYYSEGGGLSRVDARGNVRIIQGERIATGNSIIFDNTTQTIVATGSPRVWQGDNVVHGTKITVYLKEERTVVEGDPNSRASATIYPKSDKKQP